MSLQRALGRVQQYERHRELPATILAALLLLLLLILLFPAPIASGDSGGWAVERERVIVLLGAAGVSVAAALPTALLWMAAGWAVLASLLALIAAIVLLLPLAHLLPTTAVLHPRLRSLKMQAALTGAVCAAIADMSWFHNSSVATRAFALILLAILCALVAAAMLYIRRLVAGLVVSHLLLPASGFLARGTLTASNGRSIQPERLIKELRRRHLLTPAAAAAAATIEPAFASSADNGNGSASGSGKAQSDSAATAGTTASTGEKALAGNASSGGSGAVGGPGSGTSSAFSTAASAANATAAAAGVDGPRFFPHTIQTRGVRLDAAHYLPASQLNVPPAQRRWMVYFGGNGELYELLFEELQRVADDSGLGVFLFNFRSVGYSEGALYEASDLVEDALLVLEYMQDALGALPNNILLYGHSIGGAVATLARAAHSPSGPLLNDRSFGSLDAAAHGVLNNILRGITGSRRKLPTFVVRGLLASVFKGRLNTVLRWHEITGPKLLVYSELDNMLPYETVSLHATLRHAGLLADAECVALSDLEAPDPHNMPLAAFAEYHSILKRCRSMLGLAPELPVETSATRAPSGVRRSGRS